MAADGAFDAGFLAGTLTGRAVAVQPGREQVAGQVVAADEGGAHVPAEYGGPVVASAGVAAGQLPAVLPQPSPQRRLAGGRQCVGSDPHHPGAAVRAFLAVFEEEVEALRRAAGIAGALTQVPWPAQSWRPAGPGCGRTRRCLTGGRCPCRVGGHVRWVQPAEPVADFSCRRAGAGWPPDRGAGLASRRRCSPAVVMVSTSPLASMVNRNDAFWPLPAQGAGRNRLAQ